MSKFTWDIEANGLLNNDTIDYLASPYRLKDTFQMHCIVLENHETGEIIAFHDGPKYIFDGRPYEESDGKYTYVLKEYVAQDYTHFQLKDFPDFINHEGYFKDKPEYLVEMAVAHNGINYDWLATKLFYGLDYSVKYNTWGKNKVKLIDSLILSKVLNPDRKIEGKSGHSLAALSRKAGGDVKIDFRKEIPEEDRFKTFAADMLYYCIYDNKANTSVYNYLMEEWGDYDKWEGPFELEQRVADIITRQEHRGFAFNMKQAEENLAFLDAEMERLRLLVEPILPPKPATKGYLKAFIPPKLQIKKNLEPTNHMINFAKKHDGHLEERDGDWWLVMLGKEWKLPVAADEPLCDPNIPATLNDTTHIKNWLVGLGWVPSEYKDKDLTLKSGTKIKKSEEELQKGIRAYVEQTLSSNFCQDRCDHLECTPETLERKIQERIAKGKGRGLKVLTNPCFTKGQEKEICPNLQALGEKFPYATQIVEYLTYKHRRNSILGGGADWEEDEEDQEYDKGFLAAVRADGRIPTPAATCDAATSRMKHRSVANIPRVTSLFGWEMRNLFGVEVPKYFQIGYDFDSLEAKIESHYCWRYEPEPHEYCNALLLEKPNDVHTMMAKRITETIGRKFERSPAKSVKYGITYGAQADKVAKTIGSDKFTGQLVFDAFWEAAFPLARLKERLNDFWVKTGKQYVLGIDGRKVPTRSAHAILNSLFQSGGVICAKRAMVIYDDMIEEEGLSVDFFKDDWKNKDFVQQMIAYHDEAQLEVSRNLVEFKWFSPESLGWKKVDDPEEQKKIDKECLAKVEEWKHNKEKETGQIWANIHESPKGGWFTAYSRAGELAALAVTKAGEFYNLNVQLTAGYDVGNSWASCH
ncbi:DNA polymerase I [Escherichia phage vB_EcoM_3A1_SA_NWU]|uniref:DNA polymerase n=2 Tax=Escherichia coli TaxID=562 RepID=UPI001E456326|nr:DNA polymerase [Escherichia coli]MCC5411264.1 DNA polymerase [Escherichia coli]WIL78230.1 DNA polymerase I [Escherichia phage vB_EcoM_3A1_SA_NWU]